MIVRARRWAAGVLAVSVSVASAFAQTPEDTTTRASVIAEAQREKASTLAPYGPGRAEVVLQQIEEGRFPFIGLLNGFYPAVGSVHPGGGLGFGGGYRRSVGDRTRWDAHALYSVASYKRVEVTVHSPGHARGRLDVDGRAGWLDAPRISFFGLGPETVRDDHAAFRLRETYANGGVTWKPVGWLNLGVGAGYSSYDEQPGTGTFPSIDTRFTAVTAPRLGEDPSFATFTSSVGLLWLASPGYSRRGGLFRVSYSGYQRLDEEGEFGFTRTEVVQHLPLLRETWVVSLRARTDVLIGDDDDAPYFLFPSLGGGTTLRAYQTDRFRDRHNLLFSGEWRWIPSPLALDLALFVDAGRVGGRWRDVTSGRLTTDYGVGIRFHTPTATALRLEVARGDEGLRFVVTSSAPF